MCHIEARFSCRLLSEWREGECDGGVCAAKREVRQMYPRQNPCVGSPEGRAATGGLPTYGLWTHLSCLPPYTCRNETERIGVPTQWEERNHREAAYGLTVYSLAVYVITADVAAVQRHFCLYAGGNDDELP